MIKNQSWLFHLIPIIMPKRLFDWMNKEMTRFGARNPSPEFLVQEYDKAHISALKALAEVDDDKFSKKVDYPDWDPLLSGEVTLERLFHYIKTHFDLHAGQIRRIVDHRSS
jgi:hypothetical protein